LLSDFPEIKDLARYFQPEGAFESAVLEWSILNHVPLKQAKRGKVSLLLVNYNDIIANPIIELRRIFSFIESDFAENEILEKFSKRSITSFTKHKGSLGLTDKIRDKCLSILDSLNDTNLRHFISSSN